MLAGSDWRSKVMFPLETGLLIYLFEIGVFPRLTNTKEHAGKFIPVPAY